mmetsp:Transcript_90955/g.178033  ORF Transcript_90955/g.178033 Transcript_90955/m.178033 type:complete len:109 (-) Transcript_90955:125-451(-)
MLLVTFGTSEGIPLGLGMLEDPFLHHLTVNRSERLHMRVGFDKGLELCTCSLSTAHNRQSTLDRLYPPLLIVVLRLPASFSKASEVARFVELCLQEPVYWTFVACWSV